jgi:hypothetical protein
VSRLLDRAPGTWRPEGDDLVPTPAALTLVWGVLAVLLVLEATNELWGVGGPPALYHSWIHDAVLGASAALILARAAYVAEARVAWLMIGAATMSWLVGTVSWTVVYGGRAHAPYPTFADVFWLLWYVFMAVGIGFLIHRRVPGFELHRWMDGLSVALVVVAAGFAFVLQPAAAHTLHRELATVAALCYPVLDLLLIGAVLGVVAILGWRPDRMWVVLGLGVLATAVGDATFAVQQAANIAAGVRYDFVWTASAILVAYAAWVPPAAVGGEAPRSTGLPAVALPLLAQALAAGIQIYAFFVDIGRGERIVTVAVLAVASVQTYLTRPRRTAG